MNSAIATDERFEKFMQTVGSGLRNVREAQQHDLRTVAEAMEIPDEQLDLVEQGKFNWEVELITRLCNYYEVTVEEMLASSDDTR